MTRGLLGLGLAAALGATTISASTAASAPPDAPKDRVDRSREDLPHPLEEKRQALRESAISAVLRGEATPVTRNGSTVVRVGAAPSPADAARKGNEKSRSSFTADRSGKAKGQYVELEQERADKVFVILAEFGNQRHPDYPDVDTDPDTPGPTTFEGPLHNKIPKPDRTKDNTTVWQKDFDRAHYQDLYFADGAKDESLTTYYEAQSSGRYTVDGTVSDWVKVPYNEARYGREDADTWQLIRDALAAWVADQKAAGRTDAQIKAALAEHDQHDRYDFDGDGDFNEPDGYVDHFQIVHAGGDEADGDPQQGEDAIWSHRWYAFLTDTGLTGPADNRLGGTEVGSTGIWVGDYTVQPENGGLSVFVHEYGHDLGLPDAYDTSGGGDNSNEYWTLMAQSRLGAKGEPLGTRAGDLGAWEKLQLGWLDYEAIVGKDKKTLELGPQEYNTRRRQGAVVVLPKKQVTRDNGAPASGAKQFHSGSGDDLSNTLGADVDLTGKGSASLSAKIRYEIEEGYDFAYVQASTDGTTWTALDGTIGGDPIGDDTSGRPGIDGEQAEWTDLTVPLDAYAGQEVSLRFLYKTDGGLAKAGLFLDDIEVEADGATILSDGAETGGEAWELDGFSIVGATTTEAFDHFYVMGHRSYVGYDRYLKTGPYNFGHLSTKPDWAEHYAYGHGLLISYWDTSFADNNTSEHPGEGRNLPIDAHPAPIYNTVTNQPWRARIQVHDAPFSRHRGDTFTLHTNGKASRIVGQKAQPVFDDTKKYWYPELPNHGVKLPSVGIKVEVLKEDGTTLKVRFG